MFKKLFQRKQEARDDMQQVIASQALLLQQQKRVVDSLTKENSRLLRIIERMMEEKYDIPNK